MADDGLLINFAVPDQLTVSQQKFKGGAWRERRKATRGAHWRRSGEKSTQDTTDRVSEKRDNATDSLDREPSDDAQHQRPSKRQRLESHNSPWSHAPNGQNAKTGSSKPQEVISSLFSFNPAPVTIAKESPRDIEPEKPTNAPLTDGIDTFTTLGVSPILAAHLLTKLNLKAPTGIQASSISQLLKEDSDAFIQAETGSGKTLAYLLPLVQRIMDLSKQHSKLNAEKDGKGEVHRDSGLFALILAPTRELCKQISVVLEGLLRCANWIVGGTVIGGEKKKSEKARLRKGLNILVATPGRLADHLQNTQVLDVSNVRWLVLDEGDRLMDMGFEEEIQGIVKILNSRQKNSSGSRIPGLPEKRTTVLCSATMKMNVQRLGEISLKDAVLIKADETKSNDGVVHGPLPSMSGEQEETKFSAPAQLRQSYTVVPAKLRLVNLFSLLKSTFSRRDPKTVTKTIVFFSCADSVDFHFELFSRSGDASTPSPDAKLSSTTAPSPLISTPQNPNLTISKLHGSLPQHLRTSTLQTFASSSTSSILLSTDLASRGLDLPSVDLVIEYDPAFDLPSHIHRIGRTARVGRSGHAIIFLLPGAEESYIPILQSATPSPLSPISADDSLKRGFTPAGLATKSKEWEDKATEWQLEVERWVLDTPKTLESARKAYQSHIRAYATHIAPERQIFDMKALHLGHLAKAFGLRDRPANVNVPGMRTGKEDVKRGFKEKRGKSDENGRREGGDMNTVGPNQSEAARKMKAKMREQRMLGAGAAEFNIA